MEGSSIYQVGLPSPLIRLFIHKIQGINIFWCMVKYEKK
jgi:hypothetical protein